MSRHEEMIARLNARIAELEAPMLAWSELDYTKHTRRSLMCYIGQQNFRIAAQEKQIAALKAQQPSAGVVDERAAFERHFKSVGSLTVNQLAHARDTDGMPFYEHLPTRIAWSAWQARARLDQPTASAGVVVGALVSALEGIVHDERVPNEVSQDYAALLIEARRLNPCRAQAVPDGYVLVPVDPTPEMLDRYPFNVSAVTSEPMDKEDLRVVYQAMLAAAPSAHPEKD